MTNSIFGYGSLILPTSYFIRTEPELNKKREEILNDNKENTPERYRQLCLSDKALDQWRESETEFIPAKIYGFERYYALETNTEGNQLSVKHTGNEMDIINGVIATNLSDEEFNRIEKSEEPYKPLKVSEDRYETYFPEEKLENTDLPEEVTVFVGDTNHPEINYNTSRGRHPGYHQYMIMGAEMLADYWFQESEKKQEFKQEFLSDLEDTTYEMTEDEWKKISEI